MTPCECDTCWYWDYDEEYDEYYCMMDLDEDETARFIRGDFESCPYYRSGDEYTIVRKHSRY